MLNKYDKPATMRTRENRNATMPNPLDGQESTGEIWRDCLLELQTVLDVFRACDRGEYRGPFTINSPHHFVIAFESFDQREAFRKSMRLMNHGDQYWAGDAFIGSLELLQPDRSGPSFAARPNLFAKSAPAPDDSSNAAKYSQLRAEVKKTVKKLKAYTEDRTWIAVCFDSPQELDSARTRLGLPPQESAGKFVHIDNLLAAIQKTFGITLDVPAVPFGLRAESKPDKALNALIG